jgi:PHP family Zn ribbon phosphoesterase
MSPHGPVHREGLKFKKLDLHVHTPASKCFNDDGVKPEAIVREALAKNLAGIAVTDHNSGAWVDSIKKAAAGKGLTIFPGVEITCTGGKEGIHIIALFDPSGGTADIESLLKNLGLKPIQYGDINTVVKMDLISLAEIIMRRGGLAILAHGNSSRGALEDMRGQQRIDLIQSPVIAGG